MPLRREELRSRRSTRRRIGAQPVGLHDRHEPPFAHPADVDARDVLGELGPVREEPLDALVAGRGSSVERVGRSSVSTAKIGMMPTMLRTLSGMRSPSGK